MKILSYYSLLAAFVVPLLVEAQNYSRNPFPLPSTTTILLRSLGYGAQDFYLDVQNGEYTIDLVKAWNPRISNKVSACKEPLLFIHGYILNANCFIYFTDGVRPRDYSDRDINSMSIEELEELLKDDPGSNSLVFTALNFGCIVYLVNRRSTLLSVAPQLAKRAIDVPINATRLDLLNIAESLNFWKFSQDEQIQFDYIVMVDFILKDSESKKLIIVGHSIGGGLTLMALSDHPKLAYKISKVLLWAPSFDYNSPIINALFTALINLLMPVLAQLKIPFPSSSLSLLLEGLVAVGCTNPITRPTLCNAIFDSIIGPGTSQLLVENLVGKDWADSSGSREILQLFQAQQKTLMHKFDFFNPPKAIRVYGQIDPPVYNASAIKPLPLFFTYGNSDILVFQQNFEVTERRLTFPVKRRVIDGPGILFNHLGFQLHKNISKLLIIPSMKIVGSNTDFLDDDQ